MCQVLGTSAAHGATHPLLMWPAPWQLGTMNWTMLPQDRQQCLFHKPQKTRVWDPLTEGLLQIPEGLEACGTSAWQSTLSIYNDLSDHKSNCQSFSAWKMSQSLRVSGKATQQCAQSSSEPSTCLYTGIERKREIKESGLWSLSATKSSIRESWDSAAAVYPLSTQNQQSHQRRERTEEKKKKEKRRNSFTPNTWVKAEDLWTYSGYTEIYLWKASSAEEQKMEPRLPQKLLMLLAL